MRLDPKYLLNDQIFEKTYHTESQFYTNDVYSGSNSVAVIILPDGTPTYFGSLQLVSVSTHRDTQRILPLGAHTPRGYTFGPDISAGTLSFVVIDDDALSGIINWYRHIFDSYRRPEAGLPYRTYLRGATGIPPFDIIVGLDKGDPDVTTEHAVVIEGVSIVDTSIALGITRPQVGQEYAFVCMGTTDVIPTKKPDLSEDSGTKTTKFSSRVKEV